MPSPSASLPVAWPVSQDPLVNTIVVVAAGGIVLLVLLAILRRWRATVAAARRRAELRKHYGALQLQQQEMERLASRIIATSSTGGIAGFVIDRQIEAVFTEGHASTTHAVRALKALAAQLGANALINLHSERLASGKCLARGDAVIVKPPHHLPADG